MQGAEHLPVKEYYASLGIDLVDDPQHPRFEVNPSPTDEQRRLREAWLRGGTDTPSAPPAPVAGTPGTGSR